MKAVAGAIGAGLRTTFWGGISLFWLATAIPLLVLVPEALQHMAEIHLGMFASRAAFTAHAADPLRMVFGYAKIAGLLLAIFAAARFWGSLRERWWDLRTIAWRPFLIGIALNLVVGTLNELIKLPFGPATAQIVATVFMIATLPFLLLVIGPFLGDRTMTLKRAYVAGWPALVLMIGLAALAFLPGQWLHHHNHLWAIGSPRGAVWALMAWDAVLVALMACCTGAGLGAGYRLAVGDKSEATPGSGGSSKHGFTPL